MMAASDERAGDQSIMANEIPAGHGAPDSSKEGAPREQPWPEPAKAWYAVGIFAVALMFLFLDRGIITLLVEPIKADLDLSDFEISAL